MKNLTQFETKIRELVQLTVHERNLRNQGFLYTGQRRTHCRILIKKARKSFTYDQNKAILDRVNAIDKNLKE